MFLGAALAPLLIAGAASANPQGGAVVAGGAAIAGAGPALTITQTSQRAIVDWRSFSIGAGETTRFVQPSTDAAILNRVTGADPSAIYGQLTGNGRVYLINPNGVLVGPNGRIETGGFVASTLNVADPEFMAGGALRFDGASAAGIQVLGGVRADAGDVVLVAASVANSGRIEAPNGQAMLGAGGSLLYLPEGEGDLAIQGPAAAGPGAIDNRGVIAAAAVQLRAAGGPYALAVNNGGQVSATAVRQIGGRVVLDAGDGAVTDSGLVTAAAGDRGGEVTITGGKVSLLDGARIDVSGPLGGGQVRISGGPPGGDPSVTEAAETTVAAGARISASATVRGDGGEVTVWANQLTRFSGDLEALGGPEGGDGGGAEISGGRLVFTGLADLRAPRGRVGNLLLDPATLSIDAATAAAIVANLATSSQTVSASSSLSVDAPIASPATNTLSLSAPDIAVNADISLPNGVLQFLSPSTPGVSLTSAAGATISAPTINVAGDYDTVALAGPVASQSLTFDQPGVTASSITATNSANAIQGLNLMPGGATLSGDLSISSSSAMTVFGTATTTGSLTLVAAGDLTLQAATTLSADTRATLASTGGAFINQAGAGLLPANGRKVIYSATSAGGFTDGGLGYAQVDGVSYPSDPQPASWSIIYIAGLPVLTITANSFTRLYGAPDPVFTASYAGGTSADLTTPVAFRLQQSSDADVGTYTIIPYGAASATHALAYVNGTLTVSPAPLTIAAVDASRLYGAANPAFTATYAGLVNGDTPSVVSGLAFSTSATPASDVGTYAILPSGARAPNYVISYAPGALTVEPAPLTITADSVSRLYGDANPVFTASYSGLVAGDTAAVVSGLQLATDAVASSDVGGYAIRPSGASARNYVVSYVDGRLTVAPAPLLVVANDARMIQGGALPAFSASYQGLKNNDDPASFIGLTYRTTIPPWSPSGDFLVYPTIATLGGRAIDYAIRLVPGKLTVAPRPVTPIVNFDASLSKITATPSDTSPPSDNGATLLYTLDTHATHDQLFTEDQLKSLLDKADSHNTVLVCGPGCLLPPAGPARTELYSVIDAFVAGLAGATTPPLTSDSVKLALTDPARSTTMMGTLLPFLFADLSNILAAPQSEWTPQQAAFVQMVESYIQMQRRAAAQQALADYQAWAVEQHRQTLEKLAQMSGAAQIAYEAVLSTDPPTPPADILDRVTVGMTFDNTQLATFTGLNYQAGKVGDLVTSGGGSGSKGSEDLIPGATADAAKFVSAVSLFAGSADSVHLVNAFKALKTVLPNAGKVGASFAKSATLAGDVVKAERITADIAKGLGAAEAIPVVGEVVSIVGDLVQVGLAAAQYDQISKFNVALTDAVAAANQPVSTSDLKQMIGDGSGQKQIFAYLAAMLSTGGQAPPAQKATMSVADISSLSTAF